ncbi:hypothetical protein HanRHA438_Chr08g0359241 [Helianthus annuus]|nr:hypothetical protein HanIR_Chr08g0374461 [Helianthus annuus]KAJ0554178.1 hypothetical protein HanHA89_Chr08g0304751 [Helianthus annuus]KAJ0719782.1 hypothetical protein HanLR1_Chr08g0285591 [Helianthus annuus]KAJ0723008.1 hypothetical protein HanOQP8_Chr08g0293101 [Helianthus annuus]KAJ0898652.1 hypothetical protein HanRHA438_Chr08g0359241 [Helianthus annuus]
MFSFPSFSTILILFLTKIPSFPSQPTPFSSRLLDSTLQDHAFQSFPHHRSKTGTIYTGNVPANLTGITISALRLRSGSLRKRGYNGYKEFNIPKGIVENPYVKRVILVYHNLGNWSQVYYPLPGFLYLTPVVGLLGYNADNMTAKGLSELDLRAPEDPIVIKFETLKVLGNGYSPVCVFFDLFGGVVFDHVLNGSVCSCVTQGHVGIVVENSPAPVPSPAPEHVPEYPIAGGDGGGGRGGRNRGWWVGGSVAGGVLLAALVVVLVLWVRWCRGTKRIEKMTVAADRGVPLAVAAVGRAEVPVAMSTRTKPILESEYVT